MPAYQEERMRRLADPVRLVSFCSSPRGVTPWNDKLLLLVSALALAISPTRPKSVKLAEISWAGKPLRLIGSWAGEKLTSATRTLAPSLTHRSLLHALKMGMTSTMPSRTDRLTPLVMLSVATRPHRSALPFSIARRAFQNQ